MIQRIGTYIGLLLAASTLLINGARAVPRVSQSPPLYLDTGPCEQPCWQGIQPGITTVAAFESPATTAIVRQTPYRINRATDYGGTRIMSFELSTLGKLTLGDVMRTWGPPERIGYLGLDYSRRGPANEPVITAEFYYFDGLVVVQVYGPEAAPRLSPAMLVDTITYYAPGEPAYPLGKTTTWHGLASVSRYRDIFEN
jgi:hypothetical protein